MSYPSARDPKMRQFVGYRSGAFGRLEPCIEWRDERFAELDRLIAMERKREVSDCRLPRKCFCGRGARKEGKCWMHQQKQSDPLLAPSPSGECAVRSGESDDMEAL